ncbi:MAG: alcohol dehydrogenase catalytic domain-containing protein [Gemmatimonadetes bacterium]|uniref:Alcohol dehydrogenase catalytic domain-containing protein n=1 Tax=Candidatus Kutchimonas denitrificans TaxID=3056748 RepID=A0AAE4ZBS6_9BACT|nr:alcohol dehydrogenase catalytic domain-containing protein [Gemmatimonadota bacterium]NIR75416.1 alcohol dehydrogenase catalytic domain-containing protein [Candidatus Kutchimonas denitrificans]NIS01730.1 alcohol dehydrogenase catalytic domain-containing protein [Gemmatimonadota bacterium]NIT67512.1 alcohol dehydrogenase catalytic domain-containing protein [Gemmatimonadota bacterium]NIU53375.1 alcohol dehydrogenase catalytic domain-containing protein [Gemmatimonadota bacterium]
MSERKNARVYHLDRPGELRLVESPIPEPADGELVARVSVALTCGTDVKTYRRGHARLKVPGLLGHEFAGVVEHIGPGVRNFTAGDRIVAMPTAPCGDCVYCLRGAENLCLHLFEDMTLGAYGEYVLIPRHIANRNTYRIPDGTPDLQAAFLEPLACTVHGADLVDIGGDRTVLFIGDGPIALLFAQVARLRGAGRVLLAGRHAERLALARQVGVDHVIGGDAGTAGTVAELTDGLGPDVVVECVGRPDAWEEAVSLVRRGGEVLMFGGCERGSTVALDTERLHYDEITLKGGFHFTPDSVRRAWELMQGGALALEPLVTHRMSLDELPQALELMSRREAVKVAIVP